jgi:hypothetical protein
MADVDFEELGLVKALLRRFFSDGPWTAMDAASLATAVGPSPSSAGGADHVVRHPLASDLQLVAGWVDDAFFLDVETSDDDAPDVGQGAAEDGRGGAFDLGRTFDRGVVPEPTPNPRTIRFATGHRPAVTSSASHRRAHTTDPAVGAIFAADEDVVDVLVAADFVAVSLRRPDRWPSALVPVLDAVAAGFAVEADADEEAAGVRVVDPALDVRGVAGGMRNAAATSAASHRAEEPAAAPARRTTRLDRAWTDLADVDAGTPEGLTRLRAAAADDDSTHRQVAAQLLDRAALDDAIPLWDELLGDSSRAVRRAALDAIAGAADERVRPLLERALTDADAWIRWKALHGLTILGITSSLDAIAPLDDDPDFRVRLEAANARRRQPQPQLSPSPEPSP